MPESATRPTQKATTPISRCKTVLQHHELVAASINQLDQIRPDDKHKKKFIFSFILPRLYSHFVLSI